MAETRVLIPLDGSPLAETALGALEALSPLGMLRVRLVSVVEAIEGMTLVANDEHRKREEHMLRAYLDGLTERLKGSSNLAAIDSRVLSGEPVDSIVDEVRAFSPDLLVLSTHGRSGLSRWRLGSVADSVIRSRAANTLVVGPNSRLHAPIRSILVGLDGSQLSESALPQAQELAGRFQATLHLVRVIPLPVSASERYQAYLDDLTEFARSYLEDLKEQLSFAGEVLVAGRVGSPADRLIDYAVEHAIDLAVVASHGRGGIMRSTLGSVVDRLVGGPIPVLIIR